MAIVETLFVELEQFFIECKIKIDGAAKRIAGEFNAIDSGAVFWINTAIILETDILVVHRLERFECDNAIFAAANRNKVAMKIVADAKFWFFSRYVCYDFEKIIVCDIQLIDVQKFAEAIIEKLFEESFLIVIKFAGANNKTWRNREFVIINRVNDAKIKEKMLDKIVINPFIFDVRNWNKNLWLKSVLA